MAETQQRPMNEAQPLSLSGRVAGPNRTAIANTDPNQYYDETTFLKDRPIYLDPQMVPVTEQARFLTEEGLLVQTNRLPLQPNEFYQPALPFTFR